MIRMSVLRDGYLEGDWNNQMATFLYLSDEHTDFPVIMAEFFKKECWLV